MTTSSLQAEHDARHNADDRSVTSAMARWSVALPFIRALILAGIVIFLIMFGLPRVLGTPTPAPSSTTSPTPPTTPSPTQVPGALSPAPSNTQPISRGNDL